MSKHKKIYQVPADLAFAILCLLQEAAATTETICATISVLEYPDIYHRYATSTIRKAIHSLIQTEEIKIFQKQSKRYKRNYIYTITEKGFTMIDEYDQLREIIFDANGNQIMAMAMASKDDEDQFDQEVAEVVDNDASPEIQEIDKKEVLSNVSGYEQQAVEPKIDSQQTIGEVELVEGIILSKYTIDVQDQIFYIPPDIPIIYIENDTESGTQNFFQGHIITEESNLENWILNYLEDSYPLDYGVSVKVEPRYLKRQNKEHDELPSSERKNIETTSLIEKKPEDEKAALNELISLILESDSKVVETSNFNHETSGETSKVECILLTKSMVFMKNRTYSIAPDIELIYFQRIKHSGHEKPLEGRILTGRSNENQWIFKCGGKRYRVDYNVRVEIERRHLTPIA